MKIVKRFISSLLLTLTLLPVTSLADSTEDIELLLDQADAQVWLGISNKGESLAFRKGLKQIHAATAILDAVNFDTQQSKRLRQEISETEEQLKALIALYDQRFYGSYPLARLLSPKFMKGDGLAVTEQLFHPPR